MSHGDISADVVADLSAVVAARIRARAVQLNEDDAQRAAVGRAGLRGAIEALSGLVSTFDPEWDVATRRMFYLAINLQATALRDVAVELLTGLDQGSESGEVAAV